MDSSLYTNSLQQIRHWLSLIHISRTSPSGIQTISCLCPNLAMCADCCALVRMFPKCSSHQHVTYFSNLVSIPPVLKIGCICNLFRISRVCYLLRPLTPFVMLSGYCQFSLSRQNIACCHHRFRILSVFAISSRYCSSS